MYFIALGFAFQVSSGCSLQSPSDVEFQPSDECNGRSLSATGKRPKQRRRKRQKLSGNSSEASDTLAEEDSSRVGLGNDYFLTATEKRRRKAAADRDAATAREKSAAQRQREALDQLHMEKRQRMLVGQVFLHFRVSRINFKLERLPILVAIWTLADAFGLYTPPVLRLYSASLISNSSAANVVRCGVKINADW